MGYLHRATKKLEWALLAVAALMCFLPLDTQIANPVPGYAVNVAGWVLLATVSPWQRRTLNDG